MGDLFRVDEWTIYNNWLKLNKRLAERYHAERRTEEAKAKAAIRVADLKAVWNKYCSEGGDDDER